MTTNKIRNRRMKDRKRRRKLRERLAREGCSEELIEEIVAQRRWEDAVARLGSEQAARDAYRSSATEGPDDSRYRPDPGDPLLRGAGRVDGMTAKVVARSETITRWQYEQRSEKP